MPSASFSVAIASSLTAKRKLGSSTAISFDVAPFATASGDELALDRCRCCPASFLQQVRADGQQVAAGQFRDLARRCGSSRPSPRSCSRTSCSTRRSVRTDCTPGSFAPPSFASSHSRAGRLLVPVVDAADERRDQLRARIRRRRRPARARTAASCCSGCLPSAALRPRAMPSQVDASLISTRSRPMPASSYSAMSSWPLAIDALVSNDRRASTSVDTRPGMIFRISVPNAISSGR